MREEFARRITANPRNYIAQPMLALSRGPRDRGGPLRAPHVDLRPFVLLGEEPYVLRRGSPGWRCARSLVVELLTGGE